MHEKSRKEGFMANQKQTNERKTLSPKLDIVFQALFGEEGSEIVEQEDIIERILFYWAKLYVREIKKSEDYEVLPKTIVILISDGKIKSLKGLEEYHTEWKILEMKNRKKILTDKFEVHLIELDKINKNTVNMPIELIMKCTGLTKEEIENL
jgi:hypothetical protein